MQVFVSFSGEPDSSPPLALETKARARSLGLESKVRHDMCLPHRDPPRSPGTKYLDKLLRYLLAVAKRLTNQPITETRTNQHQPTNQRANTRLYARRSQQPRPGNDTGTTTSIQRSHRRRAI